MLEVFVSPSGMKSFVEFHPLSCVHAFPFSSPSFPSGLGGPLPPSAGAGMMYRRSERGCMRGREEWRSALALCPRRSARLICMLVAGRGKRSWLASSLNVDSCHPALPRHVLSLPPSVAVPPFEKVMLHAEEAEMKNFSNSQKLER